MALQFCIPISNAWVFWLLLCILTGTWFCHLSFFNLNSSYSSSFEWCLIIVLVCISLVTNDVVCLFIFLLAICIYFEVSVESFAHEKKLDYLFYYYWVLNFFYVFWIQVVYRVCFFASIFSQSMACLFVSLTVFSKKRSFKFWLILVYQLLKLRFMVVGVK